MNRDLESGPRESLDILQSGPDLAPYQEKGLSVTIDYAVEEHATRDSVRSRASHYSADAPPSVRHGSTFSSEAPAQARETEFSQQLWELLGPGIFQTYPEKNKLDDNSAGQGKLHQKKLVINIAALHRMRVRKLQANLANRVINMCFRKEEPSDWEDLLKEYTQAVRDYDFICSCSGRRHDPFILTSTRELEAAILKFELEQVPQELRKDQGDGWDDINFAAAKRKDVTTRGMQTREESVQQFLERLLMALFGGAFLVGPMWLMVRHSTGDIPLISTTVFVIAFSILMAGALRKETSSMVFSAAAAYAAVLVVFVGTTSTGSGTGA